MERGNAPQVTSFRNTSTWWLTAIVVLGAALRLFPIWFGLPYPHARPDEETAVWRAAAMLGGDLNPRFFHWPSLMFYALAALYSAASLVRRALSLDPALSQVEQLLIARVFVALAGTLTIVVLYWLVCRVADVTTALIAAAFLAVAILHVRDSHFAMTDVLMTLLVTSSLALVVRAVDASFESGHDRPALRWFAAAGLAGGLATSTKYSAAAIIAAMGIAQLLWLVHVRKAPWLPRHWTASVAFMLAFASGFLVATPYALLDFKTFSADLVFDFTHLKDGHGGVNLGRGWTYHLTHSLPYGTGVPMFLTALAGMVLMLKHRRRHALLVSGFFLAFYGALGSGTTVFFRYILPLVPVVCLMAAVAVRHAAPWLAARTALSPRASLALLIVLAGGLSLVNSVWMDLLLARTDTRVLAAEWLEARIRPGESLHDTGGDYTRLVLEKAEFYRWYFDPDTNSFGDPDGRVPDWLVIHTSPVRLYTRLAPELRRLANEKYDLVHTVHATKGGASRSVYDHQDAFFLPFSGFTTVERPGPTIRIYRRKGAQVPARATDGRAVREISSLRDRATHLCSSVFFSGGNLDCVV